MHLVSSACKGEVKCAPKVAGDSTCRMGKLNSPQPGSEEETSTGLPGGSSPSGAVESSPVAPCV